MLGSGAGILAMKTFRLHLMSMTRSELHSRRCSVYWATMPLVVSAFSQMPTEG